MTTTELIVYQVADSKVIHFCGQFSHDDVLRARSSPLGRKVLDDCMKAGASDADLLLALELIFRRSEQADAPRALPGQLWRRQGYTVFLPHGVDPNADSEYTGWEKLPW